MYLTFFDCNNDTLKKAYYIAAGDLISNIKLYKSELTGALKPVVIAGTGYWTPWTRDCAINCANAVSLLYPDIAENTFLSVLEKKNNKVYIGGEYWDKIIWAAGAWKHYCITGNKEFLRLAYEAVTNTLAYMENTEFDANKNLFRGPACYGDGVAAYPDRYAVTGESGIITYTEQRPELCTDTGVGIPMLTLSTNCLYYRAYVVADLMADELNVERRFENKAADLKDSINEHFYMRDKGIYRYLIDDFGGCDAQEGMGNSFAVLFGIANEKQSADVINNIVLTKQGIACVMPSFDRYTQPGHYGRHSGTIWPHIEAFYADAAHKTKRNDLFAAELMLMAQRAVRDSHFAEIYHPDTGEIYGGLQENNKIGIVLWDSQPRQTWSATGYMRLIFNCILGLKVENNSFSVSPYLPDDVTEVSFSGLHIRDTVINVKITGKGSGITSFLLNGESTSNACIPLDKYKNINIEICVE